MTNQKIIILTASAAVILIFMFGGLFIKQIFFNRNITEVALVNDFEKNIFEKYPAVLLDVMFFATVLTLFFSRDNACRVFV